MATGDGFEDLVPFGAVFPKIADGSPTTSPGFYWRPKVFGWGPAFRWVSANVGAPGETWGAGDRFSTMGSGAVWTNAIGEPHLCSFSIAMARGSRAVAWVMF